MFANSRNPLYHFDCFWGKPSLSVDVIFGPPLLLGFETNLLVVVVLRLREEELLSVSGVLEALLGGDHGEVLAALLGRHLINK